MSNINVLSIGNSFSQDAHKYLHDLAKGQGVKLETVNLMIGGCSLERHYRNMKGDRREYILEVNGHYAEGFLTSLKEALTARNWDYVTLQQASALSYQEESYYPYINELVTFIRKMCPKVKVLIHQTWGWDGDSESIVEKGFRTYDDMFTEIKKCYDKVAKAINADGILPSGTAFQYALRHGIESVHRDAAHASLGVGRYILALVWYHYITGNDISDVKFCDFDKEITALECQIARESAEFAVRHTLKNTVI